MIDLFTRKGYNFEPWIDRKALADGPSILTYIRKVSNEYGVEKNIRYQHKVVEARYSTKDRRWTLHIDRTTTTTTTTAEQKKVQLSAQYIYVCGGYYDFDNGYQPLFPGRESFKGIFH